MSDFVTPWTLACQASLSFTVSQFVQTHVHWVGDAIQSCHPLPSPFSPCRQSFPASESVSVSRLFTSGGHNIGASASASVLPMNIQLISFRINWFDLLAVQETLKRLLQHHYLKASVLQHSVFLMVQLWHPFMTTGKSRALTIGTFVGKVMSLLLNMLSVFVIAFLPRSICLFISWLQSLSEVISEPRKIKSVTASTSSSSIYHKIMRLGVIILIFLSVEF